MLPSDSLRKVTAKSGIYPPFAILSEIHPLRAMNEPRKPPPLQWHPSFPPRAQPEWALLSSLCFRPRRKSRSRNDYIVSSFACSWPDLLIFELPDALVDMLTGQFQHLGKVWLGCNPDCFRVERNAIGSKQLQLPSAWRPTSPSIHRSTVPKDRELLRPVPTPAAFRTPQVSNCLMLSSQPGLHCRLCEYDALPARRYCALLRVKKAL